MYGYFCKYKPIKNHFFLMTNFRISFWKLFWPILISTIITSIISSLFFFGIIGSLVSVFGSENEITTPKGTVLKLTLEGEIAESSMSRLNTSSLSIENTIGLTDLLNGFEKAARDENIKGIYLELKNPTCGISTLREIRNALLKFQKTGKFVISFSTGEYISQKHFYIASSIKERYAFTGSKIEFLGLSASPVFFKEAMAKLGIEMQIIRGKDNDFKSAVEPFMYSKMSDSSKTQTTQLTQSIWNQLLSEISQSTSNDTSKLNQIANKAMASSIENGVKFNFFKASKYYDEILSMLRAKAGLNATEEIPFHSFEKYAKTSFQEKQQLDNLQKPSLAVIIADGEIAVSGDELSSDKVARYIRDARTDKNIKTIVLRINSPGGSALASDIIWREVYLANKSKCVVVSMGDVAASGGYYIAAPASYIFAQPTTITGSIGVFGMIPYTGSFMKEKLGITFDHVKTNKFAAISLNQKLSEEEKQLIQVEVDLIYSDFLTKVASGRHLSIEKVHRLARGRVWTGSDAKTHGLVDELGGISDAIAYAIKKAKLKNPKIKFFPIYNPKPLDKLIEQLSELDENESESKVTLSNQLKHHLKSLDKIQTTDKLQMRLPFDIKL